MEKNDSELLWKLADFKKANIKPPKYLVENPRLCEGDLMSEDELSEFIKDSLATLHVLHEMKSKRFDSVQKTFVNDLKALLELGRIEADEYNELIDQQPQRL